METLSELPESSGSDQTSEDDQVSRIIEMLPGLIEIVF
jgi:hypothetical protein